MAETFRRRSTLLLCLALLQLTQSLLDGLDDLALVAPTASSPVRKAAGPQSQPPTLSESARTERDSSASWPTKPNVVLWLVDDQGWGNVGFNNDNVTTPQMDELALNQGVILHRHYTTPWCAPSRAALMTGVMPHLGLQHFPAQIPESVTLLPQAMKAAGYSTHHIGKWHLGVGWREWQYPTSRGFDTSHGFMAGAEDYVTQVVEGHGHGGDWPCSGIDLQDGTLPATGHNGVFAFDPFGWYRHALLQALNQSASDPPLFVFVALQAMHTPDPGPEVLASVTSEYVDAGITDARFARSNALITHADSLLSYAVGLLNATERWETTLLIHLSDNGGQVTDPMGAATGSQQQGGGWNTQGNNWPLRGMKRSYFEGGVRVPAFVSGGALPSVVRGRMLYGYMHIADWFSTLTELAGSQQKPNRTGSISMVSFIAGGQEGSPRGSIILGAGDTSGTTNYNEAVIDGDWKLINGSIPCEWATWQGPVFPNTTGTLKTSTLSSLDQAASSHETPDCILDTTTLLFNIHDDPTEQVNLADSNPSIVAQLLEKLAQAAADAEADPLVENEHDNTLGTSVLEDYCKEYVEANSGFLGPFLEGRELSHALKTVKEREQDSPRRHPLAFKDPGVYHDGCKFGV